MTDEDRYAELRDKMVQKQIAHRGVKDERVLDAMRSVPREKFVAEGVRRDAYMDYPLPIGCNQTISQPYMVAVMTEALELKGDENVLEIGTGSGYQTAILARLAGHVTTIERYAELSEGAGEVLEELGIGNVEVVVGDGTLGWPESAPYDGILVTAGAPEVPKPLKDQLSDDGKLVIPVGGRGMQMLRVVTRDSTRDILSCMFVPFVGKCGWEK